MSNSSATPIVLAIVVAAAVIAGAIVFTGSKHEEKPLPPNLARLPLAPRVQ